MSTFAVFGMTAGVALAEARKITKTTKPSGKPGAPPRADARRVEYGRGKTCRCHLRRREGKAAQSAV